MVHGRLSKHRENDRVQQRNCCLNGGNYMCSMDDATLIDIGMQS